MTNKGTAKPYVKCIGASATGVTQSCYIVRFKKYVIMLDCGIYQESDILTNYRQNQALLKKIKPREIDYLILHEAHADHTCLVPALYAKGCQAHIFVPRGTTDFLRVLWEDSCKIMTQDCQKIVHKHGVRASPLYTQADIETALNRCVEIDVFQRCNITKDITLTYYPSNHIINACQLSLEMQEGYQKRVLNFTGDIGGLTEQPYVLPRANLPWGNLVLGENTYNQKSRENKPYDRQKDLEKIEVVLNQAQRVLIPVFALGRCQIMMTILYQLWCGGKIPADIHVYVDSPMAQKICKLYPEDDELWDKVYHWGNLKFIADNAETLALQASKAPMVVLSSAGMLSGGKSVSWAKAFAPDPNAHIIFCGYSSQNTLASQIRYGQAKITIDGEMVENNANITELVSFSSHASREDLTEYYTERLRFNKLLLVHGEYENKVTFAKELQDKLASNGKSARVIAVNADTKIYI